MSLSNFATCELLPWDTEFFRCRIARVRGDTLTPEQAVQIDEWSRCNQIRCLYFLSRADDPMTVQTVERHGFGLVDIRVSFERVIVSSDGAARSDPPTDINIRAIQSDDLPKLQAIAKTAHTTTRFFNDTHFPRERAEELYSTWITLEAQGHAQMVWVAASTANKALGYISCHLEPNRRRGLIGLVGVNAEDRGRGIGKSLVLTAIDWFRLQGADEVVVVTQGSNRAAQHLYQQCGFLSRDLQLWYHKWYPMLEWQPNQNNL